MTATEMKYNFMLKFNSLFEFSAPAYDDRQISWLLSEGQFRVFIRKFDPFRTKDGATFEQNEVERRDLEQLIRQAYVIGTNDTGAIQITADTTSGSTYMENISDIKYLSPGAPISGTGVTPGTTILDMYDDNTVILSQAAVSDVTAGEFDTGLGKSLSQNGVHPNGLFLDLPERFLYAIEESAITNAIPDVEVNVLPVRHDAYRANIRNPYKKPYDRLVWRMDYSRNLSNFQYSSSKKLRRTELIIDPTSALDEYRVRYLQSPPDIVVNELVPEEERNCILDETLHRSIVDEAVIVAHASVKQNEYQIATEDAKRSRIQ